MKEFFKWLFGFVFPLSLLAGLMVMAGNYLNLII
jgi:hypothetical protein